VGLEGGAAKIAERLNDAGDVGADQARDDRPARRARPARSVVRRPWRATPAIRRSTACRCATVASKIVGDASADAQLEAARRLMLGGGASMVYH
jgi:hypothetical protein